MGGHAGGRRTKGGEAEGAQQGGNRAEGAEEARHHGRRLIKEVVVIYRFSTDSPEVERSFRLIHTGTGDAIDCIVLTAEDASKAAMGRLHFEKYGEPPKKVEPGEQNAPENDRWRSTLKHGQPGESSLHVDQMAPDKPRNFHCVWMHDDDCNWFEVDCD